MVHPPPEAAAVGGGPASVPTAWILFWVMVGVLLSLGLALGPFEGIPHVNDEVVYQLQARILSEGHLWEGARLPRGAFPHDFITNLEGRRYGVFPNGWPAVLALGTLVGAPWLVNPLLHGLTVWFGARLTRALAGPDAAWLAAPLVAVAPALVLQGGSRMAHTLCAALAVGAAALFVSGPRPGRALWLGAALGLLLTARPVDALIVGSVLGGWALLRGELRGWLPVLAGVAGGVVLVLLQNHLYEGDWRVFPQHAWFALDEPAYPSPEFRYTATCNQLGFGKERGCMPTLGSMGHTLGKGLESARFNARLALTLWFGLAPVGLLALGAAVHAGGRRLLGLGAAIWLGVAAVYALYWYGGVCLGPRFHHVAAPLMVCALASGAVAVQQRLRLPRVAGLTLLLPLGFTLAQALPELPGYWGVDDRLETLEADWDQGPALMLVAYGPDYLEPVDYTVTTGGGIGRMSAVQRRAMWLERRGGELVYAEYQPALVEATRATAPGLPAFLLVLTSDPALDRVLPLPATDVDQVSDLALPLAPQAVEHDALAPRQR
jgi:hypothetical protein